MTRLGGSDWSPVDDIDLWTVDRLLDGSLDPSEIPTGYEEVVSLLNVVREGVAPAQSGWGSQTVPAMVRILSAPPVPSRRLVRPAFVAAQARRATHAAAAVLVFAALGAGGAAAANGALPAPVQSAVHSAATDLGVPALAPAPTTSAHHDGGTPSTPAAPGPAFGRAGISATTPGGLGGAQPSLRRVVPGEVGEGLVQPVVGSDPASAAVPAQQPPGASASVTTAPATASGTTGTSPTTASTPVTSATTIAPTVTNRGRGGNQQGQPSSSGKFSHNSR